MGFFFFLGLHSSHGTNNSAAALCDFATAGISLAVTGHKSLAIFISCLSLHFLNDRRSIARLVLTFFYSSSWPTLLKLGHDFWPQLIQYLHWALQVFGAEQFAVWENVQNHADSAVFFSHMGFFSELLQPPSEMSRLIWPLLSISIIALHSHCSRDSVCIPQCQFVHSKYPPRNLLRALVYHGSV